MARMHARRKGKSSSRRPYVTANPNWVPMPKEDIEEFVISKGKEGMSTSMVGIILRDQYGVPSVKIATGKSILDIYRKNNLEPKIPEDLMNLLKRAVKISAHLRENPGDLHNKRQLHLAEAKIRRLSRYYKKTGTLPETWKYSLADARLMVE